MTEWISGKGSTNDPQNIPWTTGNYLMDDPMSPNGELKKDPRDDRTRLNGRPQKIQWMTGNYLTNDEKDNLLGNGRP